MKVCLECYGPTLENGVILHLLQCSKVSWDGFSCQECRYPAEKFVPQKHFETCSMHPDNLNPGFRRGYLSQPRQAGRSQAIPAYLDTEQSPTGRIPGRYSWRPNMSMSKIWMVYADYSDEGGSPELISVHYLPADAIMKSAEDENYLIGELPPNMDFTEAVKIWESSWRKTSGEKSRRERLKNWLTEEGYDEAKIDELVYNSDDS